MKVVISNFSAFLLINSMTGKTPECKKHKIYIMDSTSSFLPVVSKLTIESLANKEFP